MKKDASTPDNPPVSKDSSDMELNPHLFEQVLNASGVAMSIRDKSLGFIFTNQAFSDFYGYSADELHNHTLKDILPEETFTLYKDSITPALLSGKSWEGEYTIRTKSGRRMAVWGRFDPVFDENGAFTHAISIMRDASASMRLRNALTQTERHLHFLAENTSDCLFRLRLTDWRYDYISSAIESITGYTPQDFYETPQLFVQLIPTDWLETFEMWWGEFLLGKNRYEYESPLGHKDGSIKWINQRITLVKDDDEKPIAIEGIFTDVTERKLAERALKSSEQKYRLLAENTTDVIWTQDEDHNFTYVTPSVKAMYGYTVKEYLALDFWEFLTPNSLELLDTSKKLRAQAEAQGKYDHVNRMEMEHYRKDGSTFWGESEVRRLFSETGKPAGYQGISRDITERKRTEEALKESENKYRLLIETIEDVIWTTDNDLNYTYISPAIEQLAGYTPAEYYEMTLADTMTPESFKNIKQIHNQRLKTEAHGEADFTGRSEVERIHKDGTTVWVESIVRRLLDADGNPIGYLGISRDTSPRKTAELAIQQSENRFRTLFEDSPISLWEEDLTRLKIYFDELKEQGITDFRQHFYDCPEDLEKCATLVDVVDINKATLDLLRASSREELLGNLNKVLTESSMAAFTEEMILLATGGCEYCGEITHRTLEDEIIWVVVHFSVPPEYQESLSRVIVSLIDVTPRKRAEQALMESEERYRVLVENAQEGVVVTRNGEALFINEAMSTIFGHSNEEIKQGRLLKMVHPDDKTKVMRQLTEFVSGRKRDAFATFRILTKNKRVKWLTMTVKPIMWGGEEAQLEILTDVTIHKDLEEELRLAHAQMENRIAQRTTELSEANIQLTEEAEEREKAQEHILSLTQQLIRIQEDERQRIARDLHDNIAQDLSSIVLNMETLFDGCTGIESALLKRGEAVTSIVRGAIAGVRDIAYGLRPPALDQLGLPLAIENNCQDAARRTGVDIDFFAAGIENVKLDFDTEINIYRMVQEAINNMAKHSNAAKASVRIVKSHPDLLVRIEDNGQGFEVNKRKAEAVKERRMGLRSMEERARLIGGSMEIQSLVGTGTRIVFKIPMTKARRR